ncbi:melatonin receptor type 1C-like [Oculina patagonica]
MEKTEDARSLTTIILHTVILAATTILTLTGNSFVCLAFYRNTRLRTITSLYVMSLAVADIIMGIFCFPFHAIASGLRKWPFGSNFCQFAGFVVELWVQVSLCILALVSINRYFCFVKQQKYLMFFTRMNTVLSILVVWLCAIVLTLTNTFVTPVVYVWNPYNLYCRATFPNRGKEKEFYTLVGCFSIFPMSIVVFCYSMVYYTVRQHNNAVVPSLQSAAATNRPGVRAQEIKTSRVLFAAAFGFFVCWTPFIVILILEFGFQIVIPLSSQPIYPLLSIVSSWMNPIIYGVMNRAMRKEFGNILFCKKH